MYPVFNLGGKLTLILAQYMYIVPSGVIVSFVLELARVSFVLELSLCWGYLH